MAHRWALVLAAAVLLALTGCSLFASPPQSLVAAARDYASAVQALPGVSDADAEVIAVDPKDRPGQWRVDLVVTATAAGESGAVAYAVWGIEPPVGAVINVTLRFPKSSGMPPVSLGDPSSAAAERARTLRTLPFVESVAIANTEVSLSLAVGTRLDDAAAAIRASDVLHADPYDSVHLGFADARVALDVSLAGPSDAVITELQRLADDAGVQSVVSVEPTQAMPRPRISVQASDPSAVTTELTQLPGDSVEGRPRTSFIVTDGGASVAGFVGLALGTVEPDDLPLAIDGRAPTPSAVLAVHLAADSANLTDFLLSSVEASLAPGLAEVQVVPCTTAGMSRAEGSVLVKVFEVTDTAYPAYDAIVAEWERAGFAHTDQASGTSIYTSTVARGVVQASIIGTTEGIQLTAATECRG